MVPLQHRAAAAMAAIDNAKTPAQKFVADREGREVHADLKKQIGDDAAIAAFRKAQPQNTFGVWSGAPLTIYMVRADGKKITAPVKLPDGSMAAPNPQYQIGVPMNFLPAMLQSGVYVRANNVITEIGDQFPDPARPNE